MPSSLRILMRSGMALAYALAILRMQAWKLASQGGVWEQPRARRCFLALPPYVMARMSFLMSLSSTARPAEFEITVNNSCMIRCLLSTISTSSKGRRSACSALCKCRRWELTTS